MHYHNHHMADSSATFNNTSLNSLPYFLVRAMLAFEFSHLLQDVSVDTFNSIARKRSRISCAQTLDNGHLAFGNIDRNVMVPLKIGHLHDDLGSL